MKLVESIFRFYWNNEWLSGMDEKSRLAVIEHERQHMEFFMNELSDREVQEYEKRFALFERGEPCPDPHPIVQTCGVVRIALSL